MAAPEPINASVWADLLTQAAAAGAESSEPTLVELLPVSPARTSVTVSDLGDVVKAPLKGRAERLTHELLDDIEAARSAGELDASDVMALLPRVHKVKVDEDKVELQRAGGREDLPTFHITIGSTGEVREVRAEAARARGLDGSERSPASECDRADREVSLQAGLASLSVDVQPLDWDGSA